MKFLKYPVIAALAIIGTACSNSEPDEPDAPQEPEIPGGGSPTEIIDNYDAPIAPSIELWDGTKATDGAVDKPGSQQDIYHEANNFTTHVEVTFSNLTANVTSSNPQVKIYTDGAYVTIDCKTAAVKGVEITLAGKTDNGGVKIYGKGATKLTLNGVEIHSQRGPAINSQVNKPLFVHLADGTESSLSDCEVYVDDNVYIGTTAATEDRKGTFFAEDNVTISGRGVLRINGRQKHALAVDGALTMRPGATLVVEGAASNGIQIKGDKDTLKGIEMLGGYIYSRVDSPAGKAVKCDYDINISGGVLTLMTTGDAEVKVEDTTDTSSAACLKTDKAISITDADITMLSTGLGGKGINAVGDITIKDATVHAFTSGGRFVSDKLTASPKAVKTDASIKVEGRSSLSACVLAQAEGAEAVEAKKSITFADGTVFTYAYGDAIKATDAITIDRAEVTAVSRRDDAIDTNGIFTITGGKVVAYGGPAPESGIDCKESDKFHITGGYMVCLGGSLQALPSSSSRSTILSTPFSIAKSQKLLLTVDGAEVLDFEAMRTYGDAVLLLGAPQLKADSDFTLSIDGKTVDNAKFAK